MNNTKHTPGPWSWRDAYSNGEPVGFVVQLGRHVIADVYVGNEEDEANGKLMAAAPAMYEALQQSLVLVELAALEEWGREVTGEQQPPTTEARDRLEKVKAALAQAEGRQA